MQKVLTSAQMREVDRLTTERYGIPSIILMENAAHAVARVITEKLGGSVKGKSILILCGKGNNGGDGAALGRQLALSYAGVELILFGKVSELKGDARFNFDIANHSVDFIREIESREDWDKWFANASQDWDAVVDAIFGTGLTRPLDIWLGNVVRHINIVNEAQRDLPRFTVSVDIPSGLSADSEQVTGETFRSDATVTFTAPKAANVLAPAAGFGGELFVEDIGSPYELLYSVESSLFVTEQDDVVEWLSNSEFDRSSHKKKRGHSLLIAGSDEYSGAAVLAGNAAMRSGVGLTTLVCPANGKAEIASRLLPDVILKTIELQNRTELVSDADAIAIGCGLDANDKGIGKLVGEIIENRKVPVVVDAGALWFFNSPDGLLQKPARSKGVRQFDSSQRPPLILTPHEGEFLRVLGTDDRDVIKERVAAVREFATQHNVILVLKGERVLIGAPDGRVVVNPTGNSGLGKAGNGDTLTGILAGFTAQAAKMNIDIFETVVAAVYIAGMAGDVAERKFGKRVMTASDVRECLADVFEELGRN